MHRAGYAGTQKKHFSPPGALCDTFGSAFIDARIAVTEIAGILAIIFYLLGTLFQGQNLTGQHNKRTQVLAVGFIAAIAHGFSAFGVIRTATGYHFGIVEISTLIMLSITLMTLISSLRNPLENMLLAMFPLTVLVIIVSLIFSSTTPPLSMDGGLAAHILLSILAYSLITIAAVQAGFLSFQDYQLKHHHAGGLVRRFPPLQDMETFLFELLWAGMGLLSLGIIAGFVFVDDIFSFPGMIHKTFFSLLAWVVFAMLLWGRHQLGWRGRTAIRFTVTGFVLLVVGFYGSKFALEYVLN